jgi:hypothetical protein
MRQVLDLGLDANRAQWDKAVRRLCIWMDAMGAYLGGEEDPPSEWLELYDYCVGWFGGFYLSANLQLLPQSNEPFAMLIDQLLRRAVEHRRREAATRGVKHTAPAHLRSMVQLHEQVGATIDPLSFDPDDTVLEPDEASVDEDEDVEDPDTSTGEE